MAEIEGQLRVVPPTQNVTQPTALAATLTASKVATVPGAPAPPKPNGLAKTFSVREFDAQGNVLLYEFPMPNTADFALWTVEQQAGMLKRGVWNKLTMPDIMWGMMYAHHIDADIVKGEIFPTGEGRWGTSNKYKIRKAMETGKIKGFTSDIADTGKPLQCIGGEKCVQKTDLECTVTLDVEGLNKPIVRKAKLSRWFKGNNPNWVTNPEHMLELNTLAHACEYVTGGTTGEDEAPPVGTSMITAGGAIADTPAIPSVRELREAAQAEEGKRRAVPADVPLAQVVEGSAIHHPAEVPLNRVPPVEVRQ